MDLTLKYLIKAINLFKEKVSGVSHNPKLTIVPFISILALKLSIKSYYDCIILLLDKNAKAIYLFTYLSYENGTIF